MKILKVLLLIVSVSISKFYAQTHIVTSGIYLTAEDFKNNKLIEEEACKKEHEEFKKHDFFNRETFEVIYRGKKKIFLKNSIFAYRDCNNKTWRFYNKNEYEIIEKLDIYIYKLSRIVLNGITVEKDPVFFFSNGLKGEIMQLTNDNLKNIFSDNKEFCRLVDEELKSEIPDKVAHEYDFIHKMYKVNYLMVKSTEKK